MLSNLEPSVMPIIEGRRVVERYLGSSDSIIQQQVRKLVEGFEKFIKLALKTGRIHRSKGISLYLNNFKFEYDQSETVGGSVDILYLVDDTILVGDTSSTVLAWFSYFIIALEKSNSKIHSKSSDYYVHLDEKQIKSVRMSLKAIKGMAIENEKLHIATFGTLDSSFFSENESNSSSSETSEVESIVDEPNDVSVTDELANNSDSSENNADSSPESTVENPEVTENSQPTMKFVFETVNSPPVHTPESQSEEAKLTNAYIKKIDVDALSITLRQNAGGAAVTVKFDDIGEFNTFIDDYPEAAKRDCLSFNMSFLKRNNDENRIISIEQAIIENPYSLLLTDD